MYKYMHINNVVNSMAYLIHIRGAYDVRYTYEQVFVITFFRPKNKTEL